MKNLFLISFTIVLSACLTLSSLAQQTSFRLYFDNDQSRIHKDSLSLFQSKWQGFAKGKEIREIQIRAYCDDKAGEEYNKALSNKRANYAMQILLDMNIKEGSIQSCEGKGELALLSKDDIEGQRKTNRRVDIHVKYKLVEENTPAKPLEFGSDLKVGDKLVLENILFIGGRHYLLEESYPALDSLVGNLQRYPHIHINIIGHICCQDKGTDGLDHDTGLQNLSVARAEAVYTYLIEQGIQKERLQYEGQGANFPLGKGDKYDRRVEIEIRNIENRY